MNTPKKFLPPHLLWTLLTVGLIAFLEIFPGIPRATAQTFTGKLGSNSTTYPGISGTLRGDLDFRPSPSNRHGAKPFPGFVSTTGSRAYDAYEITNPLPNESVCVTVKFTLTNGGGGKGIFAAAYLGSFDPTDLSHNYLWDGAESAAPEDPGPKSYSFTIPPGATVVLVLYEIDPGACVGATYHVSVFGLESETFEVNSAADPGDGVCDPAGVGDGCTLRDAITAANGNLNPDMVDTIAFNIPGPEVPTITISAQLDVEEPVIIDGYTQPGASPNTANLGDNAVLLIEIHFADPDRSSWGLFIHTGQSTVRGLIVNGGDFSDILLYGENNTVRGCFIGTTRDGSASGHPPDNVTYGLFNENGAALIGGSAPGDRNVISGTRRGIQVDLHGDSITRIQNNYIGTDKNGTSALGGDFGVWTYSNSLVVGGAGPNEGNLISGYSVSGVFLGFGERGNIVQGNFIGTDATGNFAIHNGDGVFLSSNDTIGGTEPGAGNLISGNAGYGIRGNEYSNGSSIQGNLIGTNAAATTPLPNGSGGILLSNVGNIVGGTTVGAGNIISGHAGHPGIEVAGLVNLVQGNFIGTDRSGTRNLGNGVGIQFGATTSGNTVNAGNVIAFNESGGVVCYGDRTFAGDNAIFGNRIYRNNGLGIDLIPPSGGYGVTPNDPGDTDFGANHLQNFPLLNGFTQIGSTISVNGTLDTTAGNLFKIDLYSNSEIDPSGYGEGETYLGFIEVRTDDSGHAHFSFPLDPGTYGQFLTATATEPGGNELVGSTSEFSAASGPVPDHAPPPTPTPTPTPTATPTPTITPSPTPTATATPTPSPSVSPTPIPTPTPGDGVAQALNISTRAQVGLGDNVLIGGFIVTGNAPKNVILRAIGPSLGNAGVNSPLADPVLQLHKPDGSVITNDNWRASQEKAIIASGVPPPNDLESAIICTLDPGTYTAVVRGKNGGTGIGLVEVYDLDQAADSQLANISTRGFVEMGDNVLIGGIIVGPADANDTSMLIRALGPSLSKQGVSGTLADPTLKLHNANGDLIASNDNWKSSQQDAIKATGIPPSSEKEAALLTTLAPGKYTAVVAGADGGSGIGLVEVYRLPTAKP